MSDVNVSGAEFQRIMNNFYNSQGMESHATRINVDAQLVNYFLSNLESVKDKKKVAFVWICLNPPYWEYAKPMIDSAKQFFLPGHDVDYFLWSDMPKTKDEVINKALNYLDQVGQASVISQEPRTVAIEKTIVDAVQKLGEDIETIHKIATVFPTEPIEWPMPTLMRYHTFLQQEEVLAKYDYIFYCDVDMRFVDTVGDEVLGKGLTSTMNPMYALSPNFYPPYEPNPDSAAYIKRPGMLVNEPTSISQVKARFQPQYYAGGFQGGVASEFIKAMKAMRKTIDADFAKNYVAIWNEESHWNRYLFDHPENLTVLNQSYLYPDSLIEEYYKPRWGRAYQPKLITLTKKTSLRPLSSEEQAQITAMKPR